MPCSNGGVAFQQRPFTFLASRALSRPVQQSMIAPGAARPSGTEENLYDVEEDIGYRNVQFGRGVRRDRIQKCESA